MVTQLSEETGGLLPVFRGNRPYGLAIVLLALLLFVQLIRLIWLAVTPIGPVGGWQASEVRVIPPQSRLALFRSFDPFYRTGPANDANVVTSLQLTLFGIRMNEGSGLGSAILAGTDGVQDSYAVGDEIMSSVTLAAVKFDHVVIDRNGTRESLYLDQSIPAQTISADEIGTSEIDTLATAGLSAADAMAFNPRMEDGRVTGIVVNPKGDGALFSAAGLHDGDIIVAVNGQPVTSATDISSLQRQIAPGTNLSIEVERGAEVVPIVVNLGSP
ncbi:general secretion pathway protein C [Parasphingorhabdus marina DSM 22363]|uniref:General secretion pathway protein C n=1 Tax=Parasphingorhabdus marina DSM 22363 TaxID=1123272 RepID=A0A1N6CXN3_9SPHN|nr:type II secretion system protein N [Parasphingorhabdus marina]SIN63226.1 general secretion pathway protein C [Parasphingorhabdus marina DSM 22363]